MKSIARKDQTYDSFIVELLNLKIQSDSLQNLRNVSVNVEKSNPAPTPIKSRVASSALESGGYTGDETTS